LRLEASDIRLQNGRFGLYRNGVKIPFITEFNSILDGNAGTIGEECLAKQAALAELAELKARLNQQ
jgi:hypothetical protein